MKAQYTIQCEFPLTKQTGCWIFSGDSHRIPGTAISPLFPDLHGLFEWMNANGWELSAHAPTGCVWKTTHLTMEEWLLLNHAISNYSFCLRPRLDGGGHTCARLAKAVRATYSIFNPINAEIHAILEKCGHLPLERVGNGSTSWKLVIK